MINGSCSLKEGRILSYKMQGPNSGEIIFVFPGTPGSREFKFADDDLLNALNLQLVIIDRPGYGESTFLEKRQLIDWPHDVEQIMTHFQLSTVSILGYSGGGPHALACAALLPEKIKSLSIVASADPHAESELYNLLSNDAKKLCDIAYSNDKNLIEKEFASIFTSSEDILSNLLANSSACDHNIFSQNNITEMLLANLTEALKQQNNNALYEFATLLTPWNFDLNKITCPVDLWYGSEDAVELHTQNAGQFLKSNIKNADLHVLPDEGCSILWTKANDILLSLKKNAENITLSLPNKTNITLSSPKDVFKPNLTTQLCLQSAYEFIKQPVKLLDIGCGSGIIGLSLTKMKKVTEPLYLSDLSQKAIDVCLENANKENIQASIKQGNLFEPWQDNKFDFIISDVAGISEDIAALSPWYENIPIDTGKNGTELLDFIIRQAKNYLNDNGVLLFPIVSLCKEDILLKSARESFNQVIIHKEQSWPLPSIMLKHKAILAQLKQDNIISYVESFGTILCSTKIVICY